MQAVHWAMALHSVPPYTRWESPRLRKSWVYTAHHLIALYMFPRPLAPCTLKSGWAHRAHQHLHMHPQAVLLPTAGGHGLEAASTARCSTSLRRLSPCLTSCWLAPSPRSVSHPKDPASGRWPRDCTMGCACRFTFAPSLSGCCHAWFVQIHRGMMKALRGVGPLSRRQRRDERPSRSCWAMAAKRSGEPPGIVKRVRVGTSGENDGLPTRGYPRTLCAAWVEDTN